MIKEIYNFFINAYKNKDALFISNGLLLHFLLLLFRIVLWYTNVHIVFTALFGIAGINRWMEPLLFCYFPTLVTFCFLSKKNTIFFAKIYRKLSFLFHSFLNCSRLEVVFYKNWVLGFLLYLFFLFLYLFLLYIDTFLVHFRIPLLCCYGAFCVFLRKPLLEGPTTFFPYYIEMPSNKSKVERRIYC